MDKVFAVLKAVIAGIIATGVMVFIVLQYQESAIYDESKIFVYKVVPVILKEMDKETLFKYTDVSLRNSVTSDVLDRRFESYKKLGGLQNLDIINGWANISLKKSGEAHISATSIAIASFDAGEVEVSITSVRSEGDWKVLVFHISQ